MKEKKRKRLWWLGRLLNEVWKREERRVRRRSRRKLNRRKEKEKKKNPWLCTFALAGQERDHVTGHWNGNGGDGQEGHGGNKWAALFFLLLFLFFFSFLFAQVRSTFPPSPKATVTVTAQIFSQKPHLSYLNPSPFLLFLFPLWIFFLFLVLFFHDKRCFVPQTNPFLCLQDKWERWITTPLCSDFILTWLVFGVIK